MMGSITGLKNADYMALARTMDANGNNRIDNNEAAIGQRTHNKIGNQNGVVGTREFADALSKGQLLQELMNEPRLSGYDQELLVDAVTRHVSDDYTRSTLLTKMAGRSDLSESGAIKVLKAARELNDYTAGQLLDKVVSQHKLSPEAQRSAIITAGTLGNDHSISQALSKIIRTQDLHPVSKEQMMDTISQHISSDYTKNQLMRELF